MVLFNKNSIIQTTIFFILEGIHASRRRTNRPIIRRRYQDYPKFQSVFFSLDAVLLAHFSRVPKKGKIVDLCAGNGAVGLFLSKRTQAAIDAIELQPRLADMARRSIALNHLNEQMTVHTIDLKDSLYIIDIILVT